MTEDIMLINVLHLSLSIQVLAMFIDYCSQIVKAVCNREFMHVCALISVSRSMCSLTLSLYYRHTHTHTICHLSRQLMKFRDEQWESTMVADNIEPPYEPIVIDSEFPIRFECPECQVKTSERWVNNRMCAHTHIRRCLRLGTHPASIIDDDAFRPI